MASISSLIDLVGQSLSVRIAEHQLHSANIANIDTPGYKAKVSSFEAKLAEKELKDQGPDLLGKEGEKTWKLDMRINPSQAPGRADGNNVNIEGEMSQMSQNSLLYMSALNILNKNLSINKYAITAGH